MIIFPSTGAFIRQHKVGLISSIFESVKVNGVKLKALIPSDQRILRIIEELALEKNFDELKLTNIEFRDIESFLETRSTILIVDKKISLVRMADAAVLLVDDDSSIRRMLSARSRGGVRRRRAADGGARAGRGRALGARRHRARRRDARDGRAGRHPPAAGEGAGGSDPHAHRPRRPWSASPASTRAPTTTSSSPSRPTSSRRAARAAAANQPPSTGSPTRTSRSNGAGTARRGGRDLQLTRREAELLELLLRNGRGVVSVRPRSTRSGAAGRGGANAVDRYVAYLRRKLGEPPLIETVRGLGFRLSRTEGARPARLRGRGRRGGDRGRRRACWASPSPRG